MSELSFDNYFINLCHVYSHAKVYELQKNICSQCFWNSEIKDLCYKYNYYKCACGTTVMIFDLRPSFASIIKTIDSYIDNINKEIETIEKNGVPEGVENNVRISELQLMKVSLFSERKRWHYW
jgi:hypothetical protein